MLVQLSKDLAFRLTNRLASHPFFHQYFQSEEDFLELSAFEEQELAGLLSLSDDNAFEHFAAIGEDLYTRFKPPFIDVANFIDYAAGEIITVLRKQQNPAAAERVFALNQIVQNAVAKSYFFLTLRDIQQLMSQAKEASGSPLAIHLSWLGDVVSHLGGEGGMPEPDHLACDFAKWLNSMECDLLLTSMGSERESNHARISLAHRKIHQQFRYVRQFVHANAFALALSHLSILYQTVLELEQHVRNLLLNYKNREEANFFHYIEVKSDQGDDLFYFVSVRIARWLEFSSGALEPHDAVNLKKEIDAKLLAAGLDGIVLLADNEVRLFVQDVGTESSHKVVTFLEKELHPLLGDFAARFGFKVRTLGINLDNLAVYPQHKIAMLKQLPDYQARQPFKVISAEEAGELYRKTVEAEETARCATRALETGQLSVFFQPIVSRRRGERIYVESLVRAPKDDGFLRADAFIRYLEREEKMGMLDLFVLSKVGEHIPELKKVAEKVSVNIYPTSFREPEITEALISLSTALAKNGMSLVVEITEQLFLTDIESVEMLAREHGIVFSLDDFGSGYSNLIQLVGLAERGVVEILKIDGSLVKQIDRDDKVFNVISTITQIAGTLGITPIIMEYVENEMILAKLETLDANIYYQGYYFDKPLPIEKLVSKYQAVTNPAINKPSLVV